MSKFKPAFKSSPLWQRTCEYTGKPIQYAITAQGTVARRHWMTTTFRMRGSIGKFAEWEYLQGKTTLPTSAVQIEGKARVRSDI